jgi:hypothetical protein
MERTVCRNPWCKATFEYKEEDMTIIDVDIRESKIDNILNEVSKCPPSQCPKCISFSSDLSAGVEWNEKKYEGSRDDGMPHQISYKVNKFFK